MKTISVVALCAAILFSGCSNASEPLASLKIGQKCVVQFRRDALGSASPVPISPDTGNFNGAELAIGGTLTKARADSILLSTDTGEYLIPMPVILTVNFELPTPAKAAVTGTLIPKTAP
jgi:hypothetical protein